MGISDRIKKLGKYFIEMNIVDGDDGKKVIYVAVRFPTNWIIDEEYAQKRGVTILEDDMPGVYYFSTDIDVGEEAIFDVIDDNIDKMKEAIERAQLLAKKTSELKAIFENEDINIEKLRGIRFCFDGENEDIIIPKPKKDKERKKETVEDDE